MTDLRTDDSEYEPPTLTTLGSVEELTAGFDNSAFDGTTTDESDQRLKRDVARVEDPLTLLSQIRTR